MEPVRPGPRVVVGHRDRLDLDQRRVVASEASTTSSKLVRRRLTRQPEPVEPSPGSAGSAASPAGPSSRCPGERADRSPPSTSSHRCPPTGAPTRLPTRSWYGGRARRPRTPRRGTARAGAEGSGPDMNPFPRRTRTGVAIPPVGADPRDAGGARPTMSSSSLAFGTVSTNRADLPVEPGLRCRVVQSGMDGVHRWKQLFEVIHPAFDARIAARDGRFGAR